MAENVVINFSSDTSQLKSTVDLLVKMGQITEADAKAFLKLGEASAKAGKQTEDSVKGMAKSTEKAKESTSGFGKALDGLGGKLAAAFAVGSVIAFGKECVKAFEDAEKTAIILQNAVGVSGGLQSDFENLVNQSKQLEGISIFSDDDIQKAQTMALQFGLTSEQVSELLPKVLDFASATGKDLNSALSDVLGGINGVGRGLAKQGIFLDEGATKTENLKKITEQLNEKYKDQAKVVGDTAFGAQQKLNNELNNQQEIIGEKLVPAFLAATTAFSAFISGVTAAADDLGDLFTLYGLFSDKVKETKPPPIEKLASSELQKKIDNTQKLLDKARDLKLPGTEAYQKSLEDEIARYKQILDTRNKGVKIAKEEFKTAEELKKLTDEQLKSELKIANSKNGLKAQDAVVIIEREIEARKKAGEAADKNKGNIQALLDFEKKIGEQSLTALAKNEEEKLNIQRKAALEELEIKRKAAGVSSDDAGVLKANADINAFYNKQIADYKIDLAKKTADEIKKINEDNAKEDLDATLGAIDQSTSIQLLALQDRANKKLITQEEADKKGREIEINNDILKQKELIKSAEGLKEAKLGIEAELDKQIVDAKTALNNDLAQLGKDQVKDVEDAEQEKLDAIEEAEKKKQDVILQTLEIVGNSVNAIANLSSALRDARIQDLENEKSAVLAKDDAEIASLNAKFEKGHMSQKKYNAQLKALEDKKLKDQAAIDAKIKEEKRKQAIIDKGIALFNIAIDTAVNVVKLATKPVLIPYVIALGAIQAAAVVAAPLPKFHKGRLALSDSSEQHAIIRRDETIFDPNKSKEFAPTFRAIYEGKVRPSVLNDFVKLKLKNDFASNVTNSIDTMRLAYDIAYAMRDQNKVIIKNGEELGKIIADSIPRPDPRKW